MRSAAKRGEDGHIIIEEVYYYTFQDYITSQFEVKETRPF